MSFSSEWLALREPVDHAARSMKIAGEAIKYISEKHEPCITDIGSGTGSTVRALKPLLGNKVRWHLTDNDDALIDIARTEAGDAQTDFSLVDLSKSLDPLFRHPTDLFTTSAFLDLVSGDWLEKLVETLAKVRAPFYAALTYDGRAGCTPGLPLDTAVLEGFNQHQTTDKGFGPALGPQAAETAITLFERAGYKVSAETSDWQGTPGHKAFQKMLLEGWANSAIEIKPDRGADFREWYLERVRLIEDSEASCFVGHVDFLAEPQ